jgi:hypothetical protein
MSDRVAMRESIEVNRSAKDVFEFVSVGTTDPQWRTEVDRMEVNGPAALGTQWNEFSTFFRFFHMVTPASVIEINAPKSVIVQTPDGHPTWLRSIRTVEPIGSSKSRFTYELAFELSVFKHMFPIIPPASFVTWFYSKRIRKYLRNAKQILEIDSTK